MTVPSTRIRCLASMALLSLLGMGASARADVVSTFISVNPSQTSLTALNSSSTVRDLGPFNFVALSSTDPRISGLYQSFCADYFQSIHPTDTYTFQVRTIDQLPDVGTSPVNNARIQALFDNFYGVATTTDGARGAAFQLALWEIIYDTGSSPYNLGSGNFTSLGDSSATAIPIAQGWLNQIADPNGLKATGKYELIGLFSETNQDQITVHTNPVPAPAGLILIGLGAGIIALRRRFQKVEVKKGETEMAE